MTERPSVHELKCWPQYFGPVSAGHKTWELRKDDRPFSDGDTLLLKEWDPATGSYTGRWVARQVVYIARGGLVPDGFCIMSIRHPLEVRALEGK